MKLIGVRPMLLVVKFDECFRFYRDVMGFKVAWGEEGDSYATFILSRDSRLSIFKREHMAKAIGSSDAPLESPRCQDRTALIFGVSDLEKSVEEMRNRGAEFLTPVIDQHDWGIRTIFLRDPDGNLLQLETSMPKQEWTEELQAEEAKYRRKYRRKSE